MPPARSSRRLQRGSGLGFSSQGRVSVREQPHLPQHRRLVPVNPLAGDLIVAELDDDDDVDVYRL